MRFWAVTCAVLGYTWLVLGILLVCAGIAGVWMKDGFVAARDLMNPFNVVNTLVILVTLAPGIWLLMMADKLRKRLQRPKEPTPEEPQENQKPS